MCADACAANLFFDMRDGGAGVACRAAVAANLFFDSRMAANCAANLFFNRRISGGVMWRCRDTLVKNHTIPRAARCEPAWRSGMRGEPIFLICGIMLRASLVAPRSRRTYFFDRRMAASLAANLFFDMWK